MEEGGYAALPLSRPLTSLSFKMRTRTEEGLVVYVGRYGSLRDFLQLYLTAGRLHVKYSVGAEVLTFSVGGVVSDLSWHSVTVLVNGKQLGVLLDECHEEEAPSCAAACVNGVNSI